MSNDINDNSYTKYVLFKYEIKGFTFNGCAEIDNDGGDIIAYVVSLYMEGLIKDVRRVVDYNVIIEIEHRLEDDHK